MVEYKALKACRFAGVAYGKGDTIPEAVIVKKKVNALVSMGIIAVLSQDAPVMEEKSESIQSSNDENEASLSEPTENTTPDEDVEPKKAGRKKKTEEQK